MGRLFNFNASIVATVLGICCIFLMGLGSAHPVSTKNKLNFEDCPESKDTKTGKLTEATFNETLDKGVAVLKKGSVVGVDFIFSNGGKAEKLTSKAYGQVVGTTVFIPFPLSNSDGCKDSGIKCPIVAGVTEDLHTTLQIPSWVPNVSVFVKWEVVDEQEKVVFCAIFPARVGK